MLLYLRRQMQQSLLPYTPFLHTPPGHYYSALPAVPDARAAMRAVRRDACTLPGIELRATAQLELLQQLAVLASDAPFGAAPDPDRKRFYYGADNVFFYHADALIVYALLRHYAPARVIEVGSGFSSRAMLDTIPMLPTAPEFTFIEPYPARLLHLLTAEEQRNCRIIQKTVQQTPLELFQTLAADDVLFIDSTHVAKIGSDVLHILFHILPHLRKGVIIHFHDVFWPFEYPENWVLEKGWVWNEAYFLRAFLQYNSCFEILYFHSFIEACHRDTLQQLIPHCLKSPGSSLYLRKVH